MQPQPTSPSIPRVIGRYALYDEIAAGGMATVHIGRLLGEAGFMRTVAIKRLHPQYARDPDFVTMFVDEARVAARIHHPNVVSTLDVVFTDDGELFLVMEYVMGESLGKLIPATRAKGDRISPALAGTVMAGVLHGLHAAHEARDERGVPLGIVHRDVSPQNVLVGIDGTARVLDFGVAKAVGRIQTTREGQLKGKIAYMAPEQIRGGVDRTTDVYAASVVLWETLTAKRLFQGDSEAEAMQKVLEARVQPPSTFAPDVPPHLDAIVMRGLDPDPAKRFATAGEMAQAIEDALPLVAASRVGRWVQETAAQRLATRNERIAAMESNSAIRGPRPPQGSGPRFAMTPASGSVMVASPASAPTTVLGAAAATTLPPAPMPVTSPPRPSAARVILALLAVLLVLAAVGAGALVLWKKRAASRSIASPAPSAVPVPAVEPAPPAPAVSASTESSPPASEAALVQPPAPTATHVPIPVVPLTALPAATGAAPRPAPRPATGATPPKPAADCNPPYYFNAKGDRIFKQECL